MHISHGHRHSGAKAMGTGAGAVWSWAKGRKMGDTIIVSTIKNK